jgi:hypothetical protein
MLIDLGRLIEVNQGTWESNSFLIPEGKRPVVEQLFANVNGPASVGASFLN